MEERARHKGLFVLNKLYSFPALFSSPVTPSHKLITYRFLVYFHHKSNLSAKKMYVNFLTENIVFNQALFEKKIYMIYMNISSNSSLFFNSLKLSNMHLKQKRYQVSKNNVTYNLL